LSSNDLTLLKTKQASRRRSFSILTHFNILINNLLQWLQNVPYDLRSIYTMIHNEICHGNTDTGIEL